jgi:glycosyltransferase involved in cell wall biosynthesis
VRIAQVAPLYERVPPVLYGGTERVVSYLTEELVRQGHETTLFASGDSITAARLIAPCPRALRLDKECHDSLAYHIVMLGKVLQRVAEFDVIHFHVDYLHFPSSRFLKIPHLTTLHGRLDLPELPAIYKEFPEHPLISISMAQRQPLPWANWRATVYHGLPSDLYSSSNRERKYLAFLGRISPEKRVDRAIEVAKRVGMPLRIAAKVDKVDRQYFESEIRPLLDHPLIEFIGEIGENEKQEFLGAAYALLFLIDWPEPFGLVMTEAMACGTPVIGFGHGSVPEVIDEGKTGFIVENLDQAVDAVKRLPTLNPQTCREIFEQRFSAPRMAADYVTEYMRLQKKPARTLALTS